MSPPAVAALTVVRLAAAGTAWARIRVAGVHRGGSGDGVFEMGERATAKNEENIRDRGGQGAKVKGEGRGSGSHTYCRTRTVFTVSEDSNNLQHQMDR
jgi:hypothetical protein